jgi:hypothetical protein
MTHGGTVAEPIAGRVALDDTDGLVAEPFIEAASEQVVGEELDERAAQSAGLVLCRHHVEVRHHFETVPVPNGGDRVAVRRLLA